MKETPEERRIRQNFEEGTLSRSGFLGTDERHLHDIVLEDARTLERLGIDAKMFAHVLKRFIEIGKEGLESQVTYQNYLIRVIWDRGKIPCPFGDPGVHSLITANVENIKSGKSLSYTQLSVHLIARHGFFGGRNSRFRIDPAEAAEILELSQS